MKMLRILVVFKAARKVVLNLMQPRLIVPVKIDNRSVEDKQVENIIGFFVLFILFFAVASAIMSFILPDFTTAVASVAATLCNVGPGLSGIGATENYAWIPLSGKWVLIACMLLGRLEIFTVLIAFSPAAWKK